MAALALPVLGCVAVPLGAFTGGLVTVSSEATGQRYNFGYWPDAAGDVTLALAIAATAGGGIELVCVLTCLLCRAPADPIQASGTTKMAWAALLLSAAAMVVAFLGLASDVCHSGGGGGGGDQGSGDDQVCVPGPMAYVVALGSVLWSGAAVALWLVARRSKSRKDPDADADQDLEQELPQLRSGRDHATTTTAAAAVDPSLLPEEATTGAEEKGFGAGRARDSDLLAQ
jgi:hypothetical protein